MIFDSRILPAVNCLKEDTRITPLWEKPQTYSKHSRLEVVLPQRCAPASCAAPFRNDVVDQFAGDDNFLFDWTYRKPEPKSVHIPDRDMSASSGVRPITSAASQPRRQAVPPLHDKPDYHVGGPSTKAHSECGVDCACAMRGGNSFNTCRKEFELTKTTLVPGTLTPAPSASMTGGRKRSAGIPSNDLGVKAIEKAVWAATGERLRKARISSRVSVQQSNNGCRRRNSTLTIERSDK